METFSLDRVIENLSFPASGEEVIAMCERQNFPEDFMSEFRPLIEGENFRTADELHEWLSANLTTHMAGMLGGASVQDLIKRARAA